MKTHLDVEKEPKGWAKERQNLLATVVRYPNIVIDVIDAAYLAGLEATNSDIKDALQRQRAAIGEMVKNSRTIDEPFGIGTKEETARQQVLVDIALLSSSTEI